MVLKLFSQKNTNQFIFSTFFHSLSQKMLIFLKKVGVL